MCFGGEIKNKIQSIFDLIIISAQSTVYHKTKKKAHTQATKKNIIELRKHLQKTKSTQD
jgi:hypothetical protein